MTAAILRGLLAAFIIILCVSCEGKSNEHINPEDGSPNGFGNQN